MQAYWFIVKCVVVHCMYALTATATPPGVQLKFECELQDVIDAIHQNELLVLLGGFNTRVEVLDPDEESWRGVLGRHG